MNLRTTHPLTIKCSCARASDSIEDRAFWSEVGGVFTGASVQVERLLLSAVVKQREPLV